MNLELKYFDMKYILGTLILLEQGIFSLNRSHGAFASRLPWVQLAFLHSDEAKVIYGNFKTFKILLDSVCEIFSC